MQGLRLRLSPVTKNLPATRSPQRSLIGSIVKSPAVLLFPSGSHCHHAETALLRRLVILSPGNMRGTQSAPRLAVLLQLRSGLCGFR